MAEITAQLVKELRDKTGAGMMDCKKALSEVGGEIEAAVDWLRTKGLAKAAKKAGRVAAEGLVGVAVSGGTGAVVEVNSETDFVARNEQFQGMVSAIAGLALANGGSIEELLEATYPGESGSVSHHLTEAIATIGENMSLRRVARLQVNPGVVASYVHNQVVPGLGKIGVLVALESAGDPAKVGEIGRQIAMHVAAANPASISAADLDPELIDRERAVLTEQARESGKPEAVIEKMIEGRIRKYYEEVCLLEQAFVIDPDKRVKQALKDASADAGGEITVAGFVRFALGEGIEKEKSDFAAEVAAAAGGS